MSAGEPTSARSTAQASCLTRLGALPEQLVWDREGAIHSGGSRPTDAFAAFCGALRTGWLILEARNPEAKGALERSHRFMRTNFEPGRSFAGELDFQLQLDDWCDKVNARVHRTTRAVVSERLAEERARMRPLPERMPDADRRFVIRVPAQPYLRASSRNAVVPERVGGASGTRPVQERERVTGAPSLLAESGHTSPRRWRECRLAKVFGWSQQLPGSVLGDRHVGGATAYFSKSLRPGLPWNFSIHQTPPCSGPSSMPMTRTVLLFENLTPARLFWLPSPNRLS